MNRFLSARSPAERSDFCVNPRANANYSTNYAIKGTSTSPRAAEGRWTRGARPHFPDSSQTRYVRFTSSVKSNFRGAMRIQIAPGEVAEPGQFSDFSLTSGGGGSSVITRKYSASMWEVCEPDIYPPPSLTPDSIMPGRRRMRGGINRQLFEERVARVGADN